MIYYCLKLFFITGVLGAVISPAATSLLTCILVASDIMGYNLSSWITISNFLSVIWIPVDFIGSSFSLIYPLLWSVLSNVFSSTTTWLLNKFESAFRYLINQGNLSYLYMLLGVVLVLSMSIYMKNYNSMLGPKYVVPIISVIV